MTAVILAAVYDLGVGIFHLMFWRLFRWPERLPASGPVNAAITQTLNIMLTYLFFAYGLALLWAASADRPVEIPLLLGAGFWLLRAALQLILFKLRPAINWSITAVWLTGAALHGAAFHG